MLPTEAFKLVARDIKDLVSTRAMGVVHGPAGLGKTFAVEQALAHRTDLPIDLPICWVSFPGGPNTKQVANALLQELTGVKVDNLNRFVATPQVIEELIRPTTLLLVVDEAQRLNRECIEFLRHLYDHKKTNFALLLVGGDNAWAVLSREPMLRSRIYRRVPFRPLTSKQVCTFIPDFHPLYHGVDAELILLIDDHFAHGNLRDWAAFTHTASLLCIELGRNRLDERVAHNAFTLHGGTRP